MPDIDEVIRELEEHLRSTWLAEYLAFLITAYRDMQARAEKAEAERDALHTALDDSEAKFRSFLWEMNDARLCADMRNALTGETP